MLQCASIDECQEKSSYKICKLDVCHLNNEICKYKKRLWPHTLAYVVVTSLVVTSVAEANCISGLVESNMMYYECS